MNQRTERLGSEIQAVLGELIARGEIRDSRVRGAGLITFTHVRVTGDLSEARVAFTVFGAKQVVLEQVRRGLQSASAYFQQELGRRLRARKTVMLSFEVDRSLDNAFRVDGLLREAAAEHPPSPTTTVDAPNLPDDDSKAGAGEGEDGGQGGGIVPAK
jgi:ribosome-binding factor A